MNSFTLGCTFICDAVKWEIQSYLEKMNFISILTDNLLKFIKAD